MDRTPRVFIGRHYDLTPTRSQRFIAVRDLDMLCLWRIADFSSLRLVINIEFFLHKKSDRDEKTEKHPSRCAKNLLAVVLAEEWYALVYRWAQRGIYVGGAHEMRAQIFRTNLAVQTTVHSSLPDVLSSSRVLRFGETDETFLPERSEICSVIQPTL